MKLLGMLLIAACGALTGNAFAQMYIKAVKLLAMTCDMLLQLELIMEHEAPNVPVMLTILRKTSSQLPDFLYSLPKDAGACEVLERLETNEDGYTEQDRERLKIYFTQLGSADRLSELKRLKAARAYFTSRLSEERPRTEKRASLSRRLGVLCGILFAVMLI